MRTRLRQLTGGEASFALVLLVVLFAANLLVLPAFIAPQNLAGTLAVAAPFVLAAMAATPSMLSGHGGIDISVGPLLGVVNVLIISRIAPAGLDGPLTAIPLILAIGLLVGAANGFMVTVLRLQPIVATLGTYLVLSGISLSEMPQPTGQAPGWMVSLAQSIGPVPGALILVGAAALGWYVIRRTRYHRALMAVGGDDRAAFSAGVEVGWVRFFAYVVGGALAAVAGLALTGLVQSGDPTLGAQYTLIAIAAAALGGTSLSGGRGGLLGSIFGALDIYFIQNLLSALYVSAFWIQIVYGAILLASLIINTTSRRVSWRVIRAAGA